MTRPVSRPADRPDALKPAGRTTGRAVLLAGAGVLLLSGGCSSLPSIKLVEQTPPPFVPTDNLDAPRPQGDPVQRTRKLYLGVVAALRQQGRAAAALAFLDDYDRSYPRDAHAQLLRADCLMDMGQPADAEAIYRRLLDGPEEAAAQAGLGQAAAAAGRWAEAALAFGQAARLAPSTVRYLNNQGYALLQAGDATHAEFVLRKAAQLDPGNLQTRNNLILCLQREGKPVPQQQVAVDPAGAPILPTAVAGSGDGAGPTVRPALATAGTGADVRSSAGGANAGDSVAPVQTAGVGAGRAALQTVPAHIAVSAPIAVTAGE